jgi:hypothetical protein
MVKRAILQKVGCPVYASLPFEDSAAKPAPEEKVMRNFIVAASAGLALCACATDNNRVERIAVANCNAVGITEKDPQFATCRKAYGSQYIEDRLEHDYHDSLTAFRQPKLAHTDAY